MGDWQSVYIEEVLVIHNQQFWRHLFQNLGCTSAPCSGDHRTPYRVCVWTGLQSTHSRADCRLWLGLSYTCTQTPLIVIAGLDHYPYFQSPQHFAQVVLYSYLFLYLGGKYNSFGPSDLLSDKNVTSSCSANGWAGAGGIWHWL